MKSITTLLFLLFLFLGKSQNFYCQSIIQMQKEVGVFTVPCSLNGVSLKFIFDTGASDVSISLTEANFLFKNGYLTNNDIIGKAKFSDATGNISVGTVINIRKLVFSGIELNNVEASVVNSLNAPLLFGQSAMGKLGKFQFDPNTGLLIILNNSIKTIDFGTKEGRDYCESGNAKVESKDYKNALIDYNKAIAINPNYFRAYYLRGVLKSVLEDFEGAIIDFTTTIKLNPNAGMAYTYRGWTKEDLSDYKGAIVDFTNAIKIEPNDYEDLNILYWSRGNSKKQLNDQRGAIADYDKALTLDPNYAEAYFNRGHSKMVLEDYKGAISDFDKGIVINPNDALAYYNRGQSKMAINLTDSACSDWRTAGELGYESVFDDIKNYCN